jgi:hypothetical protein
MIDFVDGLNELMLAQLKIIEFYKQQWAQANALPIEERKYEANSYGIKIDDIYVFQLDGVLPHIPSFDINTKVSRKHYKIATNFITARLKNVCKLMECVPTMEPMALVIVNHYVGERIFDIDNKEKMTIVNALKGQVYHDDNMKNLPCIIELSNQVEEHPRAMIYTGPASKALHIHGDIIEKCSRIDHLDSVVVGNLQLQSGPIIRLSPGYVQEEHGQKTL